MSNQLLDGVTTVTNRIRYLSFHCWLLRSYWSAGMPDDGAAFQAYVRRAEAALVLANRLVMPGVTGLVGADGADSSLRSSSDELPLNLQTQDIALGIYSSAARQLGLTVARPDFDVPGLSEERGIELASAFDALARETRLGQAIAAGTPPETTSREDLAAFGRIARIDEVPVAEQDVLGRTLIPERSVGPIERARTGTYTLLLSSAQMLDRTPTPDDLFEAAIRSDARTPPELAPMLDGWLAYIVRDMLAVVHEAVMEAITGELRDRQGFVPATEVIASALTSEADASRVLGDLHLLEPGEKVHAVALGQVRDRLSNVTLAGRTEHRPLRRWDCALNEVAIIAAARAERQAAPYLAVVAWLLVMERLAPTLASSAEQVTSHGFDERSGRLPLLHELVPMYRRLLLEDATVGSAAAELSAWTVNQHLRVAHSRLWSDPTRDGSLLVSDGELWHHRHSFGAGRTDSRLGQALSWLRQIGLVSDDGLTASGNIAMERGLAAWREPVGG